MRSLIPNILTSLNLVFGFFSIIYAFSGYFFVASVLIVIAMLADGMDGRVARYFNASSEFGKELDSLCDLVSFGVAPAVLVYVFSLKDLGFSGMLPCVVFAICGALRLARFNVNTGIVKGYFMGLPIPAAGCVLATFVMLGIKISSVLLAGLVCLLAYLMISTVKYPDFKGKGEKINLFAVFLTLLVVAVIVYINNSAMLFSVFFGYAVFGLLNAFLLFFNKKN